jgi:DNA-binding CsgD family transcriptional regulator
MRPDMAVEVVGRDEELSALRAFVDGAPPGALVLEGEAGVGKSTLWSAGVAEARARGLRVLAARPAQVELGLGHAALGDLFEGVLDEVLAELPAPRRRALELALLLTDDPGEGLDPRTLAVAVRSVLQLLGARAPVVLAVDDVQWLDGSSADALAFALRRVPPTHVRPLLASRLGEGAAQPTLLLALPEEGLRRLHVGGMTPGALQQILQQRLGRVLSRPALLRLHEMAGGNPFFALELARALPDESDPTQPLPVPASLEAVVAARLDRLPADTRPSLLLACAHGRLPADSVAGAALAPAVAAHVVEVRDGTVRFTHPLFASVLYQAASPAERRAAHDRAAELADDPVARARQRALATEAPDAATAAELDEAAATALARGAPVVAAELAEHALRTTPRQDVAARRRRTAVAARVHLRAGDRPRGRRLAQELVATAVAGPERAEALALLAEIDDLPGAVPLLEQALDEAAGDTRLQALLHERLAYLARSSRGRRWAEPHAHAAVALAEEVGDDDLRGSALLTLALLRFDQGDPEGRALAERAYELAIRSRDERQLQQAAATLGHVLSWSVETERARALLQARHEDWRDRDERAAALPLWFLSLVEWRAGRWDVAERHAEHVRAVGAEYGRTPPQHMFPLGLVALYRGDLARASEYAARGRELAERAGALVGGIVALQGVVDHWSGDAAGAVAWFARAEEVADAADWGEPNLRWWRSEYVDALLALGRPQAARSVVDNWEAAAERVGREWVLAHVLRCRGLLAAAEGTVADAVSLLEEATARHERAGDPFGRGRALLALGIVGRRARRKRPARDAIEAARAVFASLGAATWEERAREELGHIGGRTRVEELTPAERRVARLVAGGMTNREVAATLFLGERTVASHLTHIYAKLGVRSRTELAGKVRTF